MEDEDRLPGRLAERRVVQAQLRQRLAGRELEVAGDPIGGFGCSKFSGGNEGHYKRESQNGRSQRKQAIQRHRELIGWTGVGAVDDWLSDFRSRLGEPGGNKSILKALSGIVHLGRHAQELLP